LAMFRLMGKQSGRAVAVADIGGGSAGVAIVEPAATGPIKILASERITLPFEDRASEAAVSGVLSALNDAAAKALSAYTARGDKTSSHISAAYAIVRAPWTNSKTVRASKKFEQETLIEPQVISSLGQEALQGMSDGNQANVFETTVVRVELNGYPTAKPKGKRAHDVGVALLASECEPRIRSGASDTLAHVFNCPPPTLRSGTRALLTVLRESAILPKDCFVVNMTSLGTSLIAVRKGVVVESVMVPEGSLSILKKVGGGKLPEETLTLMRLLATDQCENESCEAIKTAIAQAEPELVKVFGEALSKISSTRRIPNSLVLAAPQDLAPWLAQFLSRLDFAQFTVTTKPFTTRSLNPRDLDGLIMYAPGAKLDPGLSVACALVNIEESA